MGVSSKFPNVIQMPVAKNFHLLKTQSIPLRVALFGKYFMYHGIVIITVFWARGRCALADAC